MIDEIKHIARSGTFKVIVYVIVAIIALLLAFQAGLYVGFEKASFDNKIGENYFRAVNGSQGGIMMMINKGGSIENTHGAVGQIVDLKLPFATIEDRAGIEKTIQISTSTQIKDADGDENVTSLKLNDYVVVFGEPASSTEAILSAKLVRVLPPPSN